MATAIECNRMQSGAIECSREQSRAIEGNRPVGPQGLPPEKTLFCSKPGCGLPIGNLSSQLFSNVYLGALDDFMKRELACRHYGATWTTPT